MLDSHLTPQALYQRAGAQAFQRGEAYFSEGAVMSLAGDGDAVTAEVEGTQTYRVALFVEHGQLQGDCTCPRAADGYFCKHCVATGLAWLIQGAKGPQPAPGKSKDPWKRIRAHLQNLPAAELVELLIQQARQDDRLRLTLLRATQSGRERLAEARRLVESATTVRNLRRWMDAEEYLPELENMMDALADAVRPETAADALELIGLALDQMEDLVEQVAQESEFDFIISDLCTLHRKACEQAGLPPPDLAWHLFDLRRRLGYSFCELDVAHHLDLLGEEGLRAYRQIAYAAWEKEGKGDAGLAAILRTLARLSGDMDELLAIEAQDLSSSYRYYVITDLLQKAGRHAEALQWAERGWQAFPERRDGRLQDFLIQAYIEAGRSVEAQALAWMRFQQAPYFNAYLKLHEAAQRLGVWPELREQALQVIDRDIEKTARHFPKRNVSLRVEIALWENDAEEALRQSQSGACERHLLLTLAGRLESTRWEESMMIYRRQVPPLVEEMKNSSYAEAARIVQRLGLLWRQAGRAPEYVDYLISLRAAYKAKRNFMKLLDGLK